MVSGDDSYIFSHHDIPADLDLPGQICPHPDPGIIPNGNILSQNIVNWTFSNDEKRVMLAFSLNGKELDANVINEVINNIIKSVPNVISQRKPVILYTKVTPESCSLTIRFWSTISNADLVKSEAMIQLSAAFVTKGIGFE